VIKLQKTLNTTSIHNIINEKKVVKMEEEKKNKEGILTKEESVGFVNFWIQKNRGELARQLFDYLKNECPPDLFDKFADVFVGSLDKWDKITATAEINPKSPEKLSNSEIMKGLLKNEYLSSRFLLEFIKKDIQPAELADFWKEFVNSFALKNPEKFKELLEGYKNAEENVWKNNLRAFVWFFG